MRLTPDIMSEAFKIIECPYPLEIRFKSLIIYTVRYGIKTAAFVGSRIWSYRPSELRSQNERIWVKNKKLEKNL